MKPYVVSDLEDAIKERDALRARVQELEQRLREYEGEGVDLFDVLATEKDRADAAQARALALEGALRGVSKSIEAYGAEKRAEAKAEPEDEYDAMMDPLWAAARAALAPGPVPNPWRDALEEVVEAFATERCRNMDMTAMLKMRDDALDRARALLRKGRP